MRSYLCCSQLMLFIGIIFGLLPSVLIFYLDYYPFIQMEMHDGMCHHTKTWSFLVSDNDDYGLYIYTANVYNEINGTLIASNVQGCIGTYYESYMATAGDMSEITNRYPYNGVDTQLPTWLCTYINEHSTLWRRLRELNTNEEADEFIWTDQWIQCRYENLNTFYTNPWNQPHVANVGIQKYVTYIEIDDSSYTQIAYTTHYLTCYWFIYISSIIALIGLVGTIYMSISTYMDLELYDCVRYCKK